MTACSSSPAQPSRSHRSDSSNLAPEVLIGQLRTLSDPSGNPAQNFAIESLGPLNRNSFVNPVRGLKEIAAAGPLIRFSPTGVPHIEALAR